jgi:hypothetical protein
MCRPNTEAQIKTDAVFAYTRLMHAHIYRPIKHIEDRKKNGHDFFFACQYPTHTPGVLVWLLLHAHRHRSILVAAGHIILTPANQLMVMRLKKMVTVQLRVTNQGPSDHWPNALTNCANRAHNNRSSPNKMRGFLFGIFYN